MTKTSLFPFLALLMAFGCSGTPHHSLGTSFDPAAFFYGRTEGRGVLVYRSGEPERGFHVESEGRWQDDVFILEQEIYFADGEIQRRSFRLQRASRGRLIGTLTGVGPAVLVERGDHVELNHPVDGLPLGRMHQRLYAISDRRLLNEGTVRMMGVTVRRLHEVIRQAPKNRDVDDKTPSAR